MVLITDATKMVAHFRTPSSPVQNPTYKTLGMKKPRNPSVGAYINVPIKSKIAFFQFNPSQIERSTFMLRFFENRPLITSTIDSITTTDPAINKRNPGPGLLRRPKPRAKDPMHIRTPKIKNPPPPIKILKSMGAFLLGFEQTTLSSSVYCSENNSRHLLSPDRGAIGERGAT